MNHHSTSKRVQKREYDGKYTFDGDFSRLCVCGHSFGVHSAGSQASCLLYSLSDDDPARQLEATPDDCGCEKFRLSRRKVSGATKKWAVIGNLPRTSDAPIVLGFKSEREAEVFCPTGYTVVLFSDITQEAQERRGVVYKEDYQPHQSSNPFSF